MSTEHIEVKLPNGFKPYAELVKNAEARVTMEWRPFFTWYKNLPLAAKEIADGCGILPDNTPQVFTTLYERITIIERVAGHLTGIYPTYNEVLQRDPAKVKIQSEAEVEGSRNIKRPLSPITRFKSWLYR
ncbi:MAG: hypothetical protein HYT11_03450 [Candidatus Levybacteria bacterium]|nr:hypothetical protein [Candidatus Levybacteria bacterium]